MNIVITYFIKSLTREINNLFEAMTENLQFVVMINAKSEINNNGQ